MINYKYTITYIIIVKDLEPDECTTGDIRITSVVARSVETCVNKKWGELCYDYVHHDTELGGVLCNELGYYTPSMTKKLTFLTTM